MKTKFANYYKAVRYIENLSRIKKPDYIKGKNNRQKKLERFALFMEKLGNPQLGQRFIHITGTSGKGSVASMMQSVLAVAGYKTGLFLSPHTTAKIDRIRINNLFISPDEFADITSQIKPAVKEMIKTKFGRPSHIEICLAIAFIYFKKNKCEYIVLEAGCGGRYDASNIISAPEIAIINLVDYDHKHILGKTLKAIARQKAGIIKPNCFFLTTDINKESVLKVFRQECRKQKAKYNCISSKKHTFNLKLLGEHQQINASLVEAAGKYLKVSNKAISLGLKKTKIPCRFEIIQKKPLTIIDGAHNESKFESTLKAINNLTIKRLFIIIALTQNKSALTLYKNIAGKADFIFITKHKNNFHKCAQPEEIKKEILSHKCKGEIKIFKNPKKALEEALRKATNKDAILATGSLYLAGELRKNWVPEETILKRRKA